MYYCYVVTSGPKHLFSSSSDQDNGNAGRPTIRQVNVVNPEVLLIAKTPDCRDDKVSDHRSLIGNLAQT